MKVYIRSEIELSGRYFCDCSPFDLPSLVTALEHGGGIYDGEKQVLGIGYQFIDVDGCCGGEIIYGMDA